MTLEDNLPSSDNNLNDIELSNPENLNRQNDNPDTNKETLPERPLWLPEEFKSIEEYIQSNQELKKNYTQSHQELNDIKRLLTYNQELLSMMGQTDVLSAQKSLYLNYLDRLKQDYIKQGYDPTLVGEVIGKEKANIEAEYKNRFHTEMNNAKSGILNHIQTNRAEDLAIPSIKNCFDGYFNQTEGINLDSANIAINSLRSLYDDGYNAGIKAAQSRILNDQNNKAKSELSTTVNSSIPGNNSSLITWENLDYITPEEYLRNKEAINKLLSSKSR
jgi:hypothetical protein